MENWVKTEVRMEKEHFNWLCKNKDTIIRYKINPGLEEYYEKKETRDANSRVSKGTSLLPL